MEPPKPGDPARFTGKVRSLDITGYLMPCHENRQPFLMQLPGDGDDHFLPVFSSKEALEAGFVPLGGPPPRIVQITDGFEFLGSIPEKAGTTRIRVIVDIRIELKDGKPVSRFTEIPRGDSPLLAQMEKLSN